MKRLFFAGILNIVAITLGLALDINVADTTQLKAKAIYGKEARIIAFLLDNNHYRKITLLWRRLINTSF